MPALGIVMRPAMKHVSGTVVETDTAHGSEGANGFLLALERWHRPDGFGSAIRCEPLDATVAGISHVQAAARGVHRHALGTHKFTEATAATAHDLQQPAILRELQHPVAPVIGHP